MSFVVVLFFGGLVARQRAPEPPAVAGPERMANVALKILPSPVRTVVEGVYAEPDTQLAGGYADTQNRTWLFHVVLKSNEASPLRIEQVDARFKRGGKLLWQETYSRDYLTRLEWITGEYEMTPEYYLTKVMHGQEKPAGPDLPAKSSLSWVRIPFARPWFANVDAIELAFHFTDPAGQTSVLTHVVPVEDYHQKVTLRLPFNGTWAVNAGNDLSTGHRRTGLNGLTSYAWDFVKLGPDSRPYKTDGKSFKDYYTYNEEVRAAADGMVVYMRNDIPDYDITQRPPIDVLRKDGDVFSGNLVVLDHGNGEYSLTCHMEAGTVAVKVGDRVEAGQVLGRVGNSGFAGVPHIHFNLMAGPKWLETAGYPSHFSNFYRVRTGGPPQLIALGNPVTGWLVTNRQ
jgi:hypothetical protein